MPRCSLAASSGAIGFLGCFDHDVIGSLASITAGGSGYELVDVDRFSISHEQQGRSGSPDPHDPEVWRECLRQLIPAQHIKLEVRSKKV